MRNLSNIKGIRMKGYVQTDYMPSYRDFHNFFRTFKPVEEYTEDNHFYSPFFSRGDIIRMHDNYGDRVNPMDYIWRNIKQKRQFNLRLEYDFRFAAVNEEYCTDGEFVRTLYKIENACKGTELYISFMVSHFSQLVGKPAYAEAEHYHILFKQPYERKEEQLNKFIDRLTSLYDNISVELI